MSDENEEDNIFEDAEDEGIGDIGGGGDAGKLLTYGFLKK